jgi:hypothetical protein
MIVATDLFTFAFAGTDLTLRRSQREQSHSANEECGERASETDILHERINIAFGPAKDYKK